MDPSPRAMFILSQTSRLHDHVREALLQGKFTGTTRRWSHVQHVHTCCSRCIQLKHWMCAAPCTPRPRRCDSITTW